MNKTHKLAITVAVAVAIMLTPLASHTEETTRPQPQKTAQAATQPTQAQTTQAKPKIVVILDTTCVGRLQSTTRTYPSDVFAMQQVPARTIITDTATLKQCVTKVAKSLLPGEHAIQVIGLTTNSRDQSQRDTNLKVGKKRAKIAADAIAKKLRTMDVTPNIETATDVERPRLDSTQDVKGVRVRLIQPESSLLAADPTAQIVIAELSRIRTESQARDEQQDRLILKNSNDFTTWAKGIEKRFFAELTGIKESNIAILVKYRQDIIYATVSLALLFFVFAQLYSTSNNAKMHTVITLAENIGMTVGHNSSMQALETIRQEIGNPRQYMPHPHNMQVIPGTPIPDHEFFIVTLRPCNEDVTKATENRPQPGSYTVKITREQDTDDWKTKLHSISTGRQIIGTRNIVLAEIEKIFAAAHRNEEYSEAARQQIQRLLEQSGNDLKYRG